MNKIAVVYFSGTGNTEMMANAIADGVGEKGTKADVFAAEDFSASIRQLNECQNMEEAFDCLEELKQKYFWDSKSDAYLSFCDLLRRKYS